MTLSFFALYDIALQFTEAQFALYSGISHIWGVIQNSLEFLYIPLAGNSFLGTTQLWTITALHTQ